MKITKRSVLYNVPKFGLHVVAFLDISGISAVTDDCKDRTMLDTLYLLQSAVINIIAMRNWYQKIHIWPILMSVK